jgi:hypothetical protein
MDRIVDLATRKAGAIEVALIWDRSDETLQVFAHDASTGEELVVPVSGNEAAEVYRHPFAYTHRAKRGEGKPRTPAGSTACQ